MALASEIAALFFDNQENLWRCRRSAVTNHPPLFAKEHFQAADNPLAIAMASFGKLPKDSFTVDEAGYSRLLHFRLRLASVRNRRYLRAL